MRNENSLRVARSYNDADLKSICAALNADIVAHMATDKESTQAHVGMIEMAQACADVLSERGYRAGQKADGSDLPVDVMYESVCGVTTRLSFSVRCF